MTGMYLVVVVLLSLVANDYLLTKRSAYREEEAKMKPCHYSIVQQKIVDWRVLL